MAKGKITIHNRDTEDVFVTIKDRNTFASDPILTNKRLVADEYHLEDCELNSDGEAHLDWSAVSAADPDTKSSGSEKVAENGLLEVYAS